MDSTLELAASNGHTERIAFAEPAKKATKVAIVGVAISTWKDAPKDDPDFDLWTISNAYDGYPFERIGRHFETHDIDSHREKWQKNGMWPKLKEFDAAGKLVIGAPHAEFPNAQIFPWNALLSKYARYFTSSIAWLIALAIEEGYSEIGLWGVDMATDVQDGNSEYGHQKPCCEYLLGIAQGKGIRVTLPPGCDLLRAPRLYGLESNKGPAWEKLDQRKKMLNKMLTEKRAALDNMTREVCALEGSLFELTYLSRFV